MVNPRFSTIAALLAVTCISSVPATAQDDLALRAQELSKVFARAASAVMPSVVNISTMTVIPGRRPAIADFFPLPEELTRMLSEPPQQVRSLGSGVIIRSDGHIVTNSHVVAKAQRIQVGLMDDQVVEGSVVGLDAASDLAVVKVALNGLPAAQWADSESLEVGEWVLAIGSPHGLKHSVTAGIVSAKGRTQTAISGYEDFIQTDAAINPGNSGGPLLNMEGEVIGVNAQIITASERTGSAGVGFAIPVNIVRRIVPALIETGSYQHPYLGIEGTSLNLLLAEANDLPVQQGVYVDRVVPGGPASQVGMRGSTDSVPFDGLSVPVGGDVIVQADGQPVNNYTELLSIIESHQPGDELALTILRNGRRQEVTVELAPRPTGATS